MTLDSVLQEADRGLTYLRKNKVGKASDPLLVLERAVESYIKARNDLPNARDYQNASKTERQRYSNADQKVENLRNEAWGYASSLVRDAQKGSGRQADGLAKLVRQEERGRKILGVPYWKKPASGYVSAQIGRAKDTVTGYRTELQAIRTILHRKEVLDTTGIESMDRADDAVRGSLEKISALETQHSNLGTSVSKTVAKPKPKKGKAGKSKAQKPEKHVTGY